MTETRIQSQWDITYHKNSTGERKTVRVEADNREQAIGKASGQMDASGWYFEKSELVKQSA